MLLFNNSMETAINSMRTLLFATKQQALWGSFHDEKELAGDVRRVEMILAS
ncbi:hypothetical protein [Sphingomonas sp.]|uniref:hypothetical protein n=1 Tax=Sphingomonas sp. TaxID=28214 RepID=UPI003D6D6FDB